MDIHGVLSASSFNSFRMTRLRGRVGIDFSPNTCLAKYNGSPGFHPERPELYAGTPFRFVSSAGTEFRRTFLGKQKSKGKVGDDCIEKLSYLPCNFIQFSPMSEFSKEIQLSIEVTAELFTNLIVKTYQGVSGFVKDKK